MDSVLAYLAAAAENHPEKTALADRDNAVSYRSFFHLSRQVGAFVAGREKAPGPVGVWAKRDVFTPVLFLGVVWSGCFYVPLDPDMPARKLQKILDNCGLSLILTGSREDRLPEGTVFSGDMVSLEEALSQGEEDACPPVGKDPSQPLYMVYTSGSTGEPKGVLKSHGAMLSFLEAYTAAFSFSPEEVLGNQTPFFFDASAKDLYLSLCLGARLEILETQLFSFPVQLIERMNSRGVTFISWVPSALSIVTQLNTFSAVKPTTLKKVFFVGEVFPVKQLNRWREALPEIQYVNLYGSSELAGVCCYYEVREDPGSAGSLPIGRPLQNSSVYLVKDGKTIHQPGEIGELYVVSPALAEGYFKDPERTAAAFLTIELRPGCPERALRTGDLASYREDGLLVFAARRDYQIKHMGHRIELGEIETAASALDDVARCCCLYDEEKSKIVLFCQTVPGSAASGQDIRRALRQSLSDYMVPARVKLLPEIPLNPNGKIDRQALKGLLREK